jgi:hypothetical protein
LLWRDHLPPSCRFGGFAPGFVNFAEPFRGLGQSFGPGLRRRFAFAILERIMSLQVVLFGLEIF